VATRAEPRPTIRDVAAAAGVSVTTASHALNGYRDVSQATAQGVRQVAQALGYSPNATARGLRLHRTWLIGVVLPGVRTSYFHELLQCIEDRAEALGYGLLLRTSRGNAERERQVLQALREKLVDGVIFANSLADPAYLSTTLAGITIPLVLANPSPEPDLFPMAIADPYTGVRDALIHLRAFGHDQLLYLAGPESPMAWYSRRRNEAVRDTATPERGWRTVDTLLDCTTTAQGYAGTNAYLRQGGTATAVLAFSDHVAAGALQALYDARLRVPDDISVVGFDDLLAPVCSPPLTSVAPPKQALGDAAIALLLEQLAGQPKRSVVLPTTLCIRSSTGPAPAHHRAVGADFRQTEGR
jgi:LacI family transcriptional regulator